MKFIEYGIKPFGEAPSLRQMEWYKRERTAFFHFGMSTFTNREWGDGKEDTENFNPSNLDCRQWVRTIKNAGFTTGIITAKHHDGFCLWPSKYTQHSVKNSPYKNGKGDVVKEFTDACREYGIKAGIYLSPWDRHEKTWGSDAYNEYYANQLTELMTNYGEIWECWWDGAGSTEANYDWGRWAYIVRNCQPNAVVFGSLGATPYVEARWIGNEKGMSGDPCWSTIDSHSLEYEITSELNTGKIGGNRFIPGEADVSIRPGWFYHSEQDSKVRTPANLLRLWFESVGKNSVLLLNFPPDRRGLVSEIDAKNIYEFNKILTKALSENLANTAVINADCARNDECAPYMVLIDDEDKFYAPKDENKTPQMEFLFEEPITFNAFIISEMIEMGHRVCEYAILALIDNEWKLIARRECIGYKWAEYFDTVTTKGVRIKILDSLAVPLIRSFGLYKFEDTIFEPETIVTSEKDILKGESVQIDFIDNELEVFLGGIFPFNTIAFNGDGIKNYEIYAFNGTEYQLIYKGLRPLKKEICTFDIIDYAYKFKIKIVDNYKKLDKINIEVYKLSKGKL